MLFTSFQGAPTARQFSRLPRVHYGLDIYSLVISVISSSQCHLTFSLLPLHFALPRQSLLPAPGLSLLLSLSPSDVGAPSRWIKKNLERRLTLLLKMVRPITVGGLGVCAIRPFLMTANSSDPIQFHASPSSCPSQDPTGVPQRFDSRRCPRTARAMAVDPSRRRIQDHPRTDALAVAKLHGILPSARHLPFFARRDVLGGFHRPSLQLAL